MATLTVNNVRIIDPVLNRNETATLTAFVEGPDRTMDGAGLMAFPAFVDVHVHLRDPGFTEKETLETGAAAALHGGFGHILAMANTKPVMTGDAIAGFYARAKALPLHTYTVSALTKDLKGEVLVDMEEAARLRAVGFSDDGFPVDNMDLLKEGLLRAKALDLPISLHEEDPAYVKNPGVDSRFAPAFDLAGAEAMAEYSLSARDLSLAHYLGAKLDIQHISCALTARLVAAFAASGAKVLGEITPHHLTMTGDDVKTYGTLAKMNPPLRTAADASDLATFIGHENFCIATDHAPHTSAEKNRPLKEAPSGITGLETAFALLYTELVLKDKCRLEDLIAAMTKIPADFYKLPHKGVAGGEFVLFDPEGETTVDEPFFRGKSHNSPLLGKTLRGKIKGICVKGKYHAFE
ncbi:dihydroorotase [Peptoniphilus sp. HCN-40583]|uniref:dihydroorotase n=1 Tax=Peptoniphilus sp. HCN-40583 TaxID=3134662 RepID=UPI0030BEBC8F